jgi:hypothetical protein
VFGEAVGADGPVLQRQTRRRRWIYLSPQNSLSVLDLGWRTVGTGDMSLEVLRAWLDELPADFTADPRNLFHFAVRRLDEGDVDAATEMALMVVEFFCDAVYHHGGADELLQTVDRYITLWQTSASRYREFYGGPVGGKKTGHPTRARV